MDTVESTERLVKQAEAAFAMMPVDVPEFDHFTPAAWLIRNPKVLDGRRALYRRTWTAPGRSSRPTTNCFDRGCYEAQARLMAGPGCLCVLRQTPGEL